MSTTAPTIAPAAPTTASTLPEQPSRRPGFKLSLSSEQKAEFSAAFDAAKHSSTHEKGLPKSTNMSVAAQRPPAPASTSPQNYEEPETAEVKVAPGKGPPKTPFVRAIPCLYVSSIQASLPFYREILGFTLVGKADKTRATICRGADGDGVGGVEIYLRTAPTGPDGESVRPPPANVWIVVGDVDELHTEIAAKQARFKSQKGDDYFPEISFGEARVEGKPQNKPWGARELVAFDNDGNRITLFHEMHK